MTSERASPPAAVVAIVLAAGLGRRMGRPKADLVVDGSRLVDRAVEAARGAGCQTVIAVVMTGTEVPQATVVTNPHPETGLRDSLELGLAAASGDATSSSLVAVALLLADMPGIDSTAIKAVVDAWRPGRIAVGSYQGRVGHPVVMAPRQWGEVVALAGPDEGARRYLAAHPELVDEVQVLGDASDLDTPADVERWTGRPRR